MILEPGQRIGDRYELISRLGTGGMADVWLGRDLMLDRQVALKFLHERFAQDAEFVERFRREAQAAAGLQHPNVVGVYDRGEADGSTASRWSTSRARSLKDLIARGLSVGESVEITRQILFGVRFAHDRGIVHRDLKPQNVLVDREGPRPGHRLRDRPRRRLRDHRRPARCSAPRSTSRPSRRRASRSPPPPTSTRSG